MPCVRSWQKRSRYLYLNTTGVDAGLVEKGDYPRIGSYVFFDQLNLDLCIFGCQNPEGIRHLFCDCPVVVKLWQALREWLYYFCYVETMFEPFEVIFNMYKDAFPDMVNSIMLITKYYIYGQRFF